MSFDAFFSFIPMSCTPSLARAERGGINGDRLQPQKGLAPRLPLRSLPRFARSSSYLQLRPQPYSRGNLKSAVIDSQAPSLRSNIFGTNASVSSRSIGISYPWRYRRGTRSGRVAPYKREYLRVLSNDAIPFFTYTFTSDRA